MLILLILLLLLASKRCFTRRRSGYRRKSNIALPTAPNTVYARSRPKPPWVRDELIRLKAWSPGAGCRVIADSFNRQFSDRGITVGKTFVAAVLRRSNHEVMSLRRELKHRTPRPGPRNRTWALDLTGKTDLTGRQHLLLGLIDHGTRACLKLEPLSNKRSLTILRTLMAAFRAHGLPRRLRVDNEACMNSRVIRTALDLLGVRLQTTEPHSPWQNGRIERFFGTLKRHLDAIPVADNLDLTLKLQAFRVWYNHVRPHQHLHGRTPAEAWEGRNRSCGEPEPFVAWEGRLTGWYFPS